MTARDVMTARDAVERFLAAFDLLDDDAVFISTRSAEELLELADQLDGQDDLVQPLRGTVFAVKDNIDVAGLPTTAGCPSYSYTPDLSATAVRSLEAAGAIAVGKTNLDQFATGLVGTRSPYGIPRNPHNAMHVPGGSSSGSAVAVARHIVDFSLGTDTAGSGRVPAAFCGIIGVKPTLGRVSTHGVVPAVRSIDCVSVMASELGLADRVLAAMSGFDPQDPFSRRPPAQSSPVKAGLRVGTATPSRLGDLGADGDTLVGYAAFVAAAAAHFDLVDTDLAAFMEAGEDLYGGPWVAERTAALGDFFAGNPADCDPTVREIILGGHGYSAVEAHRAGYRRAEFQRQVELTFNSIDVLALPTTPHGATLDEVAADPIGVNRSIGRFTTFANLVDLCALSIPFGTRKDNGVPFGITLYAPAWQDETLSLMAAELMGTDIERTNRPANESLLRLVVAGAHLRGQPLEHQLTELGAIWEGTTTTMPTYRLYALAGAEPAKPGLVFDEDGTAIEVDTWLLSPAALGTFLTQIPPPLALGTVALADGSAATGFVCEPRALDGAADVTRFGGWRGYRSAGV